MKFNVNQPLNPSVPEATIDENSDLRPLYNYAPGYGLGDAYGVDARRKLVLFEGRDEYCRLRPQLGIYNPDNPQLDGSLMWDDPITENPMLGDKEVWDIINMTEDAHPIHLHLVSFKILKRGSVSMNAYVEADPGGDQNFGGSKLRLKNLNWYWMSTVPNDHQDNGWKDTGVVGPGEVMRVVARFDRKGRYVWHCHILSHEDHEMMRPFHVGNIPMDFNSIAEIEIPDAMEEGAPGLVQNAPNPFSGETNIVMNLPEDGPVSVVVMDLNGKVVTQLASGLHAAGQHTLTWDGRNAAGTYVPNGVYICQLKAGHLTSTVRMIKY